MSAAANAAGYLYAHDQLPVSDLNGRVDAPRSPHAAEPEPLKREPVKQLRTPRIEYRKKRSYVPM